MPAITMLAYHTLQQMYTMWSIETEIKNMNRIEMPFDTLPTHLLLQVGSINPYRRGRIRE